MRNGRGNTIIAALVVSHGGELATRRPESKSIKLPIIGSAGQPPDPIPLPLGNSAKQRLPPVTIIAIVGDKDGAAIGIEHVAKGQEKGCLQVVIGGYVRYVPERV